MLNISLIDAAAFVFFVGGSIIIIRISARTGKSIFKIILGFEIKPFVLLTTTNEKIFIGGLFLFSFVMFYFWTHGVITIGDLFGQ
ncbi:hypothetical protein [Methylomonas sp.]|uniref:hypothetical protein n=1 Tax=Methylomonas sp. TaxID=418 RepID=UPI0025E152D2|nr:hypothetical protein [Methylomonas sp.]